MLVITSCCSHKDSSIHLQLRLLVELVSHFQTWLMISAFLAFKSHFSPNIIFSFLPYCPLQGQYYQRGEKNPKTSSLTAAQFLCCKAHKVLQQHQAAAVTSSSHNLCFVPALCSLPCVVFLLWSQMWPEAVMLLLAHRISEAFKVKAKFKLSTGVLQIIMVWVK